MLKLFTGVFAVAGLIAATGPIIIHLLNRRRFRVVDWAAMDFLRVALQRNRRVLQMRDLILLVLRVLCIALFGLALARPYFSNLQSGLVLEYSLLAAAIVVTFVGTLVCVLANQRRIRWVAGGLALICGVLSVLGTVEWLQQSSGDEARQLTSRQAVHAVLLMDNSQSMAYESVEGSLWDQARNRAEELLDRLPADSRISVIPTCGSQAGYSIDAYRTRDDARDALKRIQVVDRGLRMSEVLELAAAACRQVPELPSKRVVLIGDQQVNNWLGGIPEASLNQIPELQVVQVAATNPQNVWISDFHVQDGIADIETPATFYASVNYQGAANITAQVTLAVDGAGVATQTLDLVPGQVREVEFKYQIDATPEPGLASFVTADVHVAVDGVQGDHLKSDNRRYLVVPVLAGIPVVFVDQHGADEDPTRNLYGETTLLRRLLAPRVQREAESRRQLIRVRHVGIDQLDRDILRDARLVVVGGVERPGGSVRLLREYVQQGGPLVITAGGAFDPAAWTQDAWLDGAGILPARLAAQPLGESLQESDAKSQLDPFFLDFSSLQHPFFMIEGESKDYLRDLFGEPLFFKAVVAETDASVIAALEQAETKRIDSEREFLEQSQQRFKQWDQQQRQGLLGDDQKAARQADQQQKQRVDPQWLLWRRENLTALQALSTAERVQRTQPRVLARYKRAGHPFLVERRIGQGVVMLLTTAVYSDWNNLPATQAVALFDRILRGLLEETLPRRTFETGQSITLPVDPSQRLKYSLERPGGVTAAIPVNALGSDAFGLIIGDSLRSGVYRVVARKPDPQRPTQPGEKVKQIPLAANSPPRESELKSIDAAGFERRLPAANCKWIAAGEQIKLEGTQISGREMWKLLIQLVLAALLMEMLVLAWPALGAPRVPEQTT